MGTTLEWTKLALREDPTALREDLVNTACGPEETHTSLISNKVVPTATKSLLGMLSRAMMRSCDAMVASCDETKDAEMRKRTKVRWPDRVRQPVRPIKVTKTDPIHGPAFFDYNELHARVVLGKKF